MGESRHSLRKRRRYPPKGPEDRIRDIVSTLLMLDILTLQTLLKHGNLDNFHNFRQLTKTHLDGIKHDGRPKSLPVEIRVRRYVDTLSGEELHEIVSKPTVSQYYREMIDLWIGACEVAGQEEAQLKYYGDSSGAEDAAREDLLKIVKISQDLYKHVNDAAVSGYLTKDIISLKIKLQSIDKDIKIACLYLDEEHQPLVHTDSADQREMPGSSLNNPPNTSIEQEKARSALAFLVPVICALSAIPGYLAWAHAENKPGTITDSGFFQLLASAPIQLLGICTALWPIINNLRPDRAAWIQSWTLATISVCFTIAAVPLYLLAPASWSGMSLLAGSFMQSFLQLQLILGIPGLKTRGD